jgi:hypothetical protein
MPRPLDSEQFLLALKLRDIIKKGRKGKGGKTTPPVQESQKNGQSQNRHHQKKEA